MTPSCRTVTALSPRCNRSGGAWPPMSTTATTEESVMGQAIPRQHPWGIAQTPTSRRILFLVSAHNSLSQRAWVALTEWGTTWRSRWSTPAPRWRPRSLSTARADRRARFLKRMIPESIWSRHRCLVVHPGPVGDRGPSSLDWAIELGARDWGVTVLEANGEFDAGRCLGHPGVPDARVGKSSIYRHEVRRAAIEALMEAVREIARRWGAATALDEDDASRGRPGATVDDPGRSRDRLAGGPHRDGAPQDPGSRGSSRGARRDRGRRVPPVRRPSRTGLRGRSG